MVIAVLHLMFINACVREALVRTRTNVTNQLHAYRHQGKPKKESIQRSQKFIAFIDKQVKQIEKEITAIRKSDNYPRKDNFSKSTFWKIETNSYSAFA